MVRPCSVTSALGMFRIVITGSVLWRSPGPSSLSPFRESFAAETTILIVRTNIDNHQSMASRTPPTTTTKKKQGRHLAETKALGHFRDLLKGRRRSAGAGEKNEKNDQPPPQLEERAAAGVGPDATTSTNNSNKEQPKVTFDLAAAEDEKELQEGGSSSPVTNKQPRRQRPNRTKQMSDDTMISMMCADDRIDDGWEENNDDETEGGDDDDWGKIAALADMSFSTCLKSGDNRRKIVESGALRVCLFAMKNNSDKPAVLAEACRFLGNLMDDDDEAHLANPSDVHDDEVVSLTKTIVHRGGIEAVVEAMAAHPNHADLQDSGCFALSRSFDSLNSSRGTVWRAGGIQAIVSAMTNHPHVKSIQCDGCAALHLVVDSSGSGGNNNISNSSRKVKRNEHYKRQVVEVGGLEAVAACLRHFPDDPEVFDDATGAMRALWPRGPPGSSVTSSASLSEQHDGSNNRNRNEVLAIDAF